jgi:hypothetical protein
VVDAVFNLLHPVGKAAALPGKHNDPVTGLVLLNGAADFSDDARSFEAELMFVGRDKSQSIGDVLLQISIWKCHKVPS